MSRLLPIAAALLLSTGTSDLVTESLILKPPAGLSKPWAVISRHSMAAPVPYGFRNLRRLGESHRRVASIVACDEA